MEAWEDAWLNNKPMPANTFPPTLLDAMLGVAERWLEDEMGPRKQLEEFVPRAQCLDVMSALLYTGFCIDRKTPYRIRPIPVITQMLHQVPTLTGAE